MKILGKNWTVGADPEIFMGYNDETFVNAYGRIEGDKENPFRVDGGAVQVDGMALEFNIDPCENFEEFNQRLDLVQDQLKQMIGDDYELLDKASVEFSDFFFSIQPEGSKILGCEPDLNAWHGQPNPTPDMDTLMRTAGGHIHIGGFEGEEWDEDHIANGARMARLMDEEVGVYSILYDTDDKRRKLYGKAGAFRPKSYGMEYRSLSNKWLFSQKTRKFVFDGVVRAITRFMEGDEGNNRSIIPIINTSNRDSDFFKGNPIAAQLMEA